MIARAASSPHRLYVSAAAHKLARLPAPLRKRVRDPAAVGLRWPVCVVAASEMLRPIPSKLPTLNARAETRYLVLIDAPEPALVRLPRVLGLNRPEYRLHQTRDAGALRRLLVALAREEPMLGIVDAYVTGADLHVLTGDFEFRCFPMGRIPALSRLASAHRSRFTLDEDGSYLHWPAGDVHLGVSQILQEVDPAFMGDVAIRRSEHDRLGPALRAIREERGLRQSDITGIGERQVHRLETGVSRLRYASAQKFAKAFRMTASALLTELAQRASAERTRVTPARARTRPDNEPV